MPATSGYRVARGCVRVWILVWKETVCYSGLKLSLFFLSAHSPSSIPLSSLLPPPPPPPSSLSLSSRGLLMGVWNAHTSIGNILATIIPSFWADSNMADPPWGWSFLVPAFITAGVGVLIFLFLVPGEQTEVSPLLLSLFDPRWSARGRYMYSQ